MSIKLQDVLTPSEDYEFYKEVVDLAESLKIIVEDTKVNVNAINDKTALTSEEVARRLVRVAYKIDLSAADNTSAYSSLAQISDVLEEMTAKLEQSVEQAMDDILSIVAGRTEAYIKPPSGAATVAVIKPGEPTDQA